MCTVCTAHTGYEMFTTTVELWQNVLRSENVPAKINFTYESINLKRTTQVEDKKKRYKVSPAIDTHFSKKRR